MPFNNTSTGINARSQSTSTLTVTDNTVYGHDNSASSVGIRPDGAEVSQNIIHSNSVGIEGRDFFGPSIIRENRVYNNSNVGIWAERNSEVLANQVYSNSVGILGRFINFNHLFRGLIENNVVYANGNQGIVLDDTQVSGNSHARVFNNTVFQEVGDAIRVINNSEDVELKNNILWVDAGFDIFVDSTSQQGFQSDFNVLRTTGSGQLGEWGGTAIASRVDWFYELGLDGNSQTTDPLFVDRDGPDNILGFSTDTIGPAVILDDEDPGVVLSGTWTETTGSGGLNDDYWQAGSGTGDAVATWTFTGLTPGATYQVATTWQQQNSSLNASNAPYQVFDGSTLVSSRRINQRTSPGDFNDAGVAWERLTTVELVGNTLTVQLTNDANGRVRADAVRIQQIEGDHAADDDFHVQSTSPAIDTGDPLSFSFAEPTPNGGRINVGRYGNTSEATLSDPQLVQVLSPNGLEKFEIDQQVPVSFRSDGLTTTQAVALVNTGNSSETVDNWLAEQFRTEDSTSNLSFADPVDTTLITNPAPEAVYQNYGAADFGIGQRLAYDLPLADGTYDVRLHFVEPDNQNVGDRVFDILLNSSLVQDDFDIMAATGTRYQATTLSYNVTTSGGAGLLLELLNETSNRAILSAIEITQANPGGLANPTVDIQLSRDGGATFSETLATGITLDRFGDGSFAWIVTGAETNQAFIRVVSSDVGSVLDASNEAFLIANAGTSYYVNDGNLVGDEYTTAVGDNANSGKTPNAPLASLQALLSAYDLDPGDTIFVDTGDYTPLANIVITSDDSGVFIQGPVTGEAILDRANTSTGSYVFELVDADDVTISDLTITGANTGVFAGTTSDSDNLTVQDSHVTGNSSRGIELLRGGNNSTPITNDNALISGNTISNNRYNYSGYGIRFDGLNVTISGNTIFDNGSRGIRVNLSTANATTATISGNTVFGNQIGIRGYAPNFYSSSNTLVTISGNTVFDNTSIGIDATRNTFVAGNTVYGHDEVNAVGIRVNGGSEAAQNIVHGNFIGIEGRGSSGSSIIRENRVYDNSNVGIRAELDSQILANQVYSNSSIGILGQRISGNSSWAFRGLIENNVVYANGNQGIVLDDTQVSGNSHARVFNNTVFQEVGDAIQVINNSQEVELKNNILWVEAGFDIFVDSTSQQGFQSDFNLFQTGSDPNALVGKWGGVAADLLVDWQTLTGQDANSVSGDPLFVDRDGADNILGFSGIGGGTDGGSDDNFFLASGSTAIDRADTWVAPLVDIEGFSRQDDPGTSNLGSNDYLEQDLGSSQFAATGTAQGWRSDDSWWNFSFPAGFTFDFYGESYDRVNVASNGFLQFANSTDIGDATNTAEELANHARIAPLWDDLTTAGTGDDIYLDTSLSDRVTIRWDATNKEDSSDVNVAVTLFDNGRFEFHYGSGNANLSPTVGISQGKNRRTLLSLFDAGTTMTNANSR